MSTLLARSSTGTIFVRENGRPSMADQVIRYLTSSTAAELHPTVPKPKWSLQYKGTQVFLARLDGDIAYLAYPTVVYSHVRGLRTNT
jgi:hypothetical protein